MAALVDEQVVLNADADAAELRRHILAVGTNVDARLHGKYHAGHDARVARHMRRIVHIHSEVMGDVVWTEAVALRGQLLEVGDRLGDQSDLLQVLAQLEAGALEQLVQGFAPGPHDHVDDVQLQLVEHLVEGALRVGEHSAGRPGAGDVAGVAAVLAAGVHQHHVPLPYDLVVAHVVDNGGVPAGGHHWRIGQVAGVAHAALEVNGREQVVLRQAGPALGHHLVEGVGGNVAGAAHEIHFCRGLEHPHALNERVGRQAGPLLPSAQPLHLLG